MKIIFPFLFLVVMGCNSNKRSEPMLQNPTEIKEWLAKQQKDTIAIKGHHYRTDSEKKEAIDSILKPLNKAIDDMTNTITYRDNRLSYYRGQNLCYAYIENSKRFGITLNVSIYYHGKNWLYTEHCTFKCDSVLHTLDVMGLTKEVADGGVNEWFDTSCGDSEIALLRDITNSHQVKMRYTGSSFYLDRYLTANEIGAIKNVLNKYEAVNSIELDKNPLTTMHI